MRSFGVFLIILGVVILVCAMSMDVSVSTGMGGRVNNLGLMADRQNYTMIGGIMAIAGLLMRIFGGKKQEAVQTAYTADSRPCPLCAEPIKKAAIKCKHCGSDVAAHGTAKTANAQKQGWTVRIPCEAWAYADTLKAVQSLGLSTLQGEPQKVIVGFLESETDAKAVSDSLKTLRNLEAHPYWMPGPP